MNIYRMKKKGANLGIQNKKSLLREFGCDMILESRKHLKINVTVILK